MKHLVRVRLWDKPKAFVDTSGPLLDVSYWLETGTSVVFPLNTVQAIDSIEIEVLDDER